MKDNFYIISAMWLLICIFTIVVINYFINLTLIDNFIIFYAIILCGIMYAYMLKRSDIIGE
jgi:hypothetical protein